MRFIRGLFIAIVVAGALSTPSLTKADVALGLNFSFPTLNAGLHARVSNFFITTSWFFDAEYLGLGVDYIIWNPKLSDDFALYVAPGVWAGFGSVFTLGLELPSGVVWNGVKWLEVYAQVIPSFMLIDTTSFDVGGSVGFRFVL